MCVSTRTPFGNNFSEMQMGGEHLPSPLIHFDFAVQIAGNGATGRMGGCTVDSCVMTLLLITIMFITSRHAILSGPFSFSQPRFIFALSPSSRISAHATFLACVNI